MSRPLKNKSGAGIKFERAVGKALEAMGAIVASLRHVKGPGDHLAVFPDGRIWLIESKASEGIGACSRTERKALLEAPLPPNAERYIALKDGHLIRFVESAEWPSNGD